MAVVEPVSALDQAVTLNLPVTLDQPVSLTYCPRPGRVSSVCGACTYEHRASVLTNTARLLRPARRGHQLEYFLAV